MKTRRLGSRAGWRRMKTRRALATSGRSPACAGAGSARPRVGSFFARQVVDTKKPVHRTQPDRDPARGRKRAADFLQGQVGLPGNQLQHPRSMLAQPGATVATHRARARMALGPPALRPADGAADADIKPHRRRPCAAAQRHKADHTLPQPQLRISLEIFAVEGDGRLSGSESISDEAGENMDHGVHGRPVA
jgi:hypothetical protein